MKSYKNTYKFAINDLFKKTIELSEDNLFTGIFDNVLENNFSLTETESTTIEKLDGKHRTMVKLITEPIVPRPSTNEANCKRAKQPVKPSKLKKYDTKSWQARKDSGKLNTDPNEHVDEELTSSKIEKELKEKYELQVIQNRKLSADIKKMQIGVFEDDAIINAYRSASK
eukprot:NODE_404_length_9277_cov_0.359407.p4 type:complete len:170 gc:universal NODE_404_length_9277_cov_0.359407:223-732(+)